MTGKETVTPPMERPTGSTAPEVKPASIPTKTEHSPEATSPQSTKPPTTIRTSSTTEQLTTLQAAAATATTTSPSTTTTSSTTSELISLRCYLRRCIQGSMEPEMARVEVKAFEPPSAEERDSMTVEWADDGQAVFHDVCWKALIDSYKQDNPFTLSPLEKSMVKEAWKTAEYFDSMAKIRVESARIAAMLKTAKYAIVFTGAGISTAAGIGDFRGRLGKWTERDREKIHGSSKLKRPQTAFVLENMRPTYTHEAIVKLLELGYLKHIISQNTDGIHRLSGVPRDKISELHGNSFIEKCEKCNTRYELNRACLRTNTTVPAKICQHCHIDHRTGRMCERKDCDGYNMNTIINFGDGLEHHVLTTADEHAKKNDLIIVLGSSLRVTPACDLVELGQKPIRIIINNRQPTPFDQLCYQVIDENKGPLGSRLFCDCDIFLREIMKNLLDPDDLEAWEEGQEDRAREYDKKRLNITES